MKRNRQNNPGRTMRDVDVLSGPGKICQAMQLNLEHDGIDMITSEVIWLEAGRKIPDTQIVADARINIDYAEEWALKPLRFTIKGSRYV
eukprot:CAMPEP_0174270686 /NCGR_PEP_ID=MMETSP0439-20130205/45375_1 /TAXON_ID=0 /ORGANISM="Stereomyxa ramosa, Strain Chinc5" /LENGTH=88 /DNA_ID=CAMNT_0015360167 /DNA_START=461 /DNA_END=724 /DNA_ORIENTATION=-